MKLSLQSLFPLEIFSLRQLINPDKLELFFATLPRSCLALFFFTFLFHQLQLAPTFWQPPLSSIFSLKDDFLVINSSVKVEAHDLPRIPSQTCENRNLGFSHSCRFHLYLLVFHLSSSQHRGGEFLLVVANTDVYILLYEV